MRTISVVMWAALAAGCAFGDNRTSQSSDSTDATDATDGTDGADASDAQDDAGPALTCGDGERDPGEGCDDGNTSSGDGCTADCAVEAINPECGNGVRELGEACDLGAENGAGSGCSDTCLVEDVCGNDIREASEECDDGNTAAGDGCSPTCSVETATSCELVPQSGCPAGQACDLADEGRECRAVTAPGRVDSSCSSETACASGHHCLQDGAASYCLKFCASNSDCEAGARCASGLTDDAGVQVAKVCSNRCEVVDQTGCPALTGCIGIQNSAGDYTECVAMGGTSDFQTCSSTLDCLPGALCANTSDGPLCLPYCELGSLCSSGLCTPFSQPLVIDGVELGACL